MSRSAVRKWLFYLLHLAGFILLYLVIRDLEWQVFLEVLGDFPAWKYLTGIGVLLGVYVLKSYRWHLLNRSFGIKTGWKSSLVFYLSAGFLSVITPGRLGEFAKIFFLRRRYGIDLPAATSSVLLDRVWDVLVLSLAAGISLVILLSGRDSGALGFILVVLIFAASVLVIALPSVLFRPVLFTLRGFPRLHGKMSGIFLLWKNSRSVNFVPALLISTAAFLALAYLTVLFSGSTTFRIGYASGVGAISISNILSFLPVTFAGFGTRELVFSEIWALENFPKEAALSVSTAYFMVTYLGSLLIGGVVYLVHFRQLYRPAEIREMATGTDLRIH